MDLTQLTQGLPVEPLPPKRGLNLQLPHAPKRQVSLNSSERKLAVRNALRYIPHVHHAALAPEFTEELETYGHIYMYRFRPTFSLKAYPIEQYPAKTTKAAALMLMITNNLDPAVAQFPEELVTYGGNGQVFSNWAQFWLTMKYLSEMEEEQTLSLCSGHPLGIFPSNRHAPLAVITNGMMIPNYSSRELYDRYFALGVTMYGQMTAGSFCYIGPQGIVHGTTITVMSAARKYLGVSHMGGKVFVSSGLGGMSGAQPKAGVIAGCIALIAEVNPDALEKRFKQGWLLEKCTGLEECITLLREYLVKIFEETGELLVDLGSDQTSCHNVYDGGYYPVGISFKDANELMVSNPGKFREAVRQSLLRHILAIEKLTKAGMHFWDYGNAFLLECQNAGANIVVDSPAGTRFKYPSYVQDIMGDIFSMGFGPFRWVCCSGDPEDLSKTDQIALDTMERIVAHSKLPEAVKEQYNSNMEWIQAAKKHNLVVGSQARILYSDQEGRIAIALQFNKAIREGILQGPVVISRDHHDVSGTDSPYRETSNINDGSSFTADMAVQNVIGDSFRGATWVALHNGGGVGWGQVINGGFGMVLDGSEDCNTSIQEMLAWDVSNGVSRRGWAGNSFAQETAKRTMKANTLYSVTLPFEVNQDLL